MTKKHLDHWQPHVDRVAEILGLSIEIRHAVDWRCEIEVISPTHLTLFEMTLAHPSYAPTKVQIGSKGALLHGIDTDVWFADVAGVTS